MKLFKKIKRRVRDVISAAKGEPWGDVRPLQFNAPGQSVKVETYAAEHFIGIDIDEFLASEVRLDFCRQQLAHQIASGLLAAGYFEEEIRERPHELGLRGKTLRLTLRVVRTEEASE